MPVVCGSFTTLESLDAVATLDKLGFSLDDPIWESDFCFFVDDGGFVAQGQKCGAFTLEDLNYFGTIDSLQYSLDDEIWTREDVCVIYAPLQTIDATASVQASANSLLSGNADITGSAEVIGSGVRYRTSTGAIDATATASASAIVIFTGSGSITAQATVEASAIRFRFSTGSINGSATVSSIGYATYSGAGAINGSASVLASGIRYRLGAGAISSSATVDASGIRYRTSTGSVTGTASVSSLGGVIYGGTGTINGIASVSAYPNAEFNGKGAISSLVNIICKGTKAGENWSPPVAPPTGDWQGTTPPTDSWTGTGTPTDNWTGVPTTDPNWKPEITDPVIGDLYKGGYYVGTTKDASGGVYDLVMSPIANEIAANRWEEVFNFFGLSDYDGSSNNILLIEKNKFGIAKNISSLTINGYKDWYFPAKDELTTMVNASKAFTKNTDQKLKGNGYWSSTNKPTYSMAIRGWIYYVWAYDFSSGSGGVLFNPPPAGSGTLGYRVRPVRRIKR